MVSTLLNWTGYAGFSTGAGSAEVIDYVGIPTLPAIIEALDALEEDWSTR